MKKSGFGCHHKSVSLLAGLEWDEMHDMSNLHEFYKCSTDVHAINHTIFINSSSEGMQTKTLEIYNGSALTNQSINQSQSVRQSAQPSYVKGHSYRECIKEAIECVPMHIIRFNGLVVGVRSSAGCESLTQIRATKKKKTMRKEQVSNLPCSLRSSVTPLK